MTTVELKHHILFRGGSLCGRISGQGLYISLCFSAITMVPSFEPVTTVPNYLGPQKVTEAEVCEACLNRAQVHLTMFYNGFVRDSLHALHSREGIFVCSKTREKYGLVYPYNFLKD